MTFYVVYTGAYREYKDTTDEHNEHNEHNEHGVSKMDPKECLRRWIEADTPQERKSARDDYNSWRDKGGFAAKVRVIGDEREGVVTRIHVGPAWKAHVSFGPGDGADYSPWQIDAIL